MNKSLRGFSLLELLVVLAVLAFLASMLLPKLQNVEANGAKQATLQTMNAVRDAILGRDTQPGYLADMGALPGMLNDLAVERGTLNDLFNIQHIPTALQTFNINSKRGWHGPYLNTTGAIYTIPTPANGFTTNYCYTNAVDAAVFDGWSNPIVIQRPTTGTDAEKSFYTRLISAGPDGILQTVPNDTAIQGDDVVVPLVRNGLK